MDIIDFEGALAELNGHRVRSENAAEAVIVDNLYLKPTGQDRCRLANLVGKSAAIQEVYDFGPDELEQKQSGDAVGHPRRALYRKMTKLEMRPARCLTTERG